MEPRQYTDAIGREARAAAATVDVARHQPVAACPGWDVAALCVHLGYVFRWAAQIVRTGAAKPAAGDWTCGVEDPALASWLVEGADEVRAVLDGADPDAPVWTMGPPRNVRFWYRRQAVEALIHRWDCEAAAGAPGPLDPELAAQGVGELLEVLAPRQHRRAQASGAGETYHVHRTDGPGEWFVRLAPEGMEVTAEHAKADVALRGPAGDLLLVLWRRLPPGAVDTFGDRAVLDRWFDLVPAL